MDQVDFNPVFFLSDDLTNAYLDYKIPMSWEFQNDLVILNLIHEVIRCFDQKGPEKNIVGGPVNISDYKVDVDHVIAKTEDTDQLENPMTGFKGLPAFSNTRLWV